MTKVCISTIIILMAINIGLYAQDNAEHADTLSIQAGELRLELVWEKEILLKIKDWWPYMSNFIFLDEDGYNLFSSASKSSAEEMEHKKLIYIQNNKIHFLKGDNLIQTKAIDLGYSSRSEISKNGRNIIVINPIREGDHYQEGEPAMMMLFDSHGKMLGEDTVGLPSDIFPLGNDKIIVLEYGEWSEVVVFRLMGNEFVEIRKYDGYFLDYAEDGSCALISIDPYGKKERVVIDSNGTEMLRYHFDKPAWRGFISPKGNYFVEVTRGKYIVLFDRNGSVIDQHHVQGIGNYFASFSPDEYYLCVTPGAWRVYFLKTQTGELISEYTDPDSTSGFQSIAISAEPTFFFIGSSIIDPVNWSSIYTNEKRGMYIFNEDGLLVGKNRNIFTGKGFVTHLHSAALRCDASGEYLLAETPSKCYLFKLLIGRIK